MAPAKTVHSEFFALARVGRRQAFPAGIARALHRAAITTMKTNIALLLSTAGLLHAGTTPAETEALPVDKPEAWITPTLDIRARYEFADIDELDVSHALTLRERVGLKTLKWNGFSAFIEGEFSQAVVDDYNAGAGPDAEPFDPFNSLIADPETHELNQLYLQYDRL